MLDIQQTPNAVVVKLSGDLGQPESKNLDLELKSIIAQSPPLVVLDMSGVTMLASTAVASLLMLNRSVRKYGGRMRLAALTRQVLGALHFTRLDDILENLRIGGNGFGERITGITTEFTKSTENKREKK